jgi:hypothetical protein
LVNTETDQFDLINTETDQSPNVEECYCENRREEEEEEEEVQLNSSQQPSTSTSQPSSQQSSTSTPQLSFQQSSSQQLAISPTIIDPSDIIIRSQSNTPERRQSRHSTPVVELSITELERRQSRRSTPVVEQPITGPAQSQHSTPPMVRQSSSGPLTNIEAMLVKQGKQIRVLYKL